MRLTFAGSNVTSDAGLLAHRELDEALGLTETAGKRLEDSRTGRNARHALLPLIRQSIYSRLAGYEEVKDAERLCIDPAMRNVGGGRASQRKWPRRAANSDGSRRRCLPSGGTSRLSLSFLQSGSIQCRSGSLSRN